MMSQDRKQARVCCAMEILFKSGCEGLLIPQTQGSPPVFDFD